MGIGQALLEEGLVDSRNGRTISNNMAITLCRPIRTFLTSR